MFLLWSKRQKLQHFGPTLTCMYLQFMQQIRQFSPWKLSMVYLDFLRYQEKKEKKKTIQSYRHLPSKQLLYLIQVSQISKLNFFEEINDSSSCQYLYTVLFLTSSFHTIIWHNLSTFKHLKYFTWHCFSIQITRV